jgi:signal peptidase II
MLKYLGKKFFVNLIIVISIFGLDRVSKNYVINLSKNIDASFLPLTKYLNISLIWNEGIAFGLFSFNEIFSYNLMTLLILIVIIIILIMVTKNTGLRQLSLLIIFGGAIGNLYDRIYFNAVPDFIDFHVGNFHWFIFNVSDIFITLGVLLMITLELIGYKKEADEKI